MTTDFEEFKNRMKNYSIVYRVFNKFAIVFVVLFLLKINSVIDWSWAWVTLPLWLVPALFLISLIIITLIQWYLKLLTRF